jgi:hypothetical protein
MQGMYNGQRHGAIGNDYAYSIQQSQDGGYIGHGTESLVQAALISGVEA